MITEQNFRDIMDTDLEVDDQKYGHTDIDKISKGHASKKCYELAKQMCTEYGQFIMESLGWFHPDNPPERNNKNSKELFEIYLNESK